ncbi:Retinol dehydrogenase 8 [Trichoderma lentiforme]|uniref:Retinol dehydrogenase 8 n=1 Tax=Trichoderma lentiforme TaxID=1567552 RepID=A0A9P4XA67_9HYPO|nr:Retinol dehydrogenase 8 [Trichoderma lentiforme]
MTVFLVTGASSGLGLALSLEALRRGHRVIGATRDSTKARTANPEFERLGGVWLSMDVSSSSCEDCVRNIAEKENVDVLINSAGYALLGPVEQISDVEAHAQMETNFHGTLRTVRGVLPTFRSRRSGTIVNITSGAGFIGLASRGLYCSSKFAVEGLSEALANELAQFSIRIIIAEPGAYRTNFLETLTFPEASIGAYSGTPAGKMMELTKDMKNRKLGNVDKAASVLLDVILGSGVAADETIQKCLRVPLGQDCWPLAKKEAEAWVKELEVIEAISMSVGVEE